MQGKSPEKEASKESVSVPVPSPERYTVEQILDYTFDQFNRKMYLIKWAGYDIGESTWELATAMEQDIPDIVRAYEARRTGTPLNKKKRVSKEIQKKETPSFRRDFKPKDVRNSKVRSLNLYFSSTMRFYNG